MARIVDENFETQPGYEESWSETVTAGNTLNEDSTIPGTPPNGAGSQCLQAILTATKVNAYATRTVGDTNVNYIRGYLYWSEEGLNDGQLIVTLNLFNSAAASVAEIRLTQTAGALKVYFRYYSGGAFQNTAEVSIALNTWYRIEYRYDITAMLWEWKIDGVSQASGSLSATIRTPNYLTAGGAHNGAAQSTLYTDLVVWDDATWPGEEAGGLPIPIVLGKNVLGRKLLGESVLGG